MGLWGRSLLGRIPILSGVEPRYMEQLLDRVCAVVGEAVRAAAPVTVRAARFDVPADWFRNDRKGGGKDDFGHALAFDGREGRVATLVNFAAHPETLWEGNPHVSADYPGALRRRLRATSAGVPLFFSGALGGMVTPNVVHHDDVELRMADVERIGSALADVAAAALAGAAPVAGPTLRVARLPLAIPLKNWQFRLMHALGIMDREFLLDRVRTEMNLVSIGDAVSMLTAPGECTPEVGREIVARMAGDHRLLFCLGCDELGYVLTPAQFEHPEWGYEQTMSVGPDIGPVLWDGAARLTGMKP
jgi:hypothetical protein